MRFRRNCIIVFFIILPMISIVHAQSQPAFREAAHFGRGDIQTIEWHPSGERVLISTVLGTWIHSADFTSEVFLPEARLATFSPDGRFIAGIDFSDTVRIWDTESLQPVWEMNFLLLRVQDIVWSPDSRYLAVAGVSNGYEHVLVWDTRNDEIHELRGYGEHFDELVWSPEGRYLGGLNSDNGAVAAWMLGGERIFNEPAPEDKGGLKIAWPREGELMRATVDNFAGSYVELWNVATGSLLLSDELGTMGDIGYSFDGQFLAASIMDYMAILPSSMDSSSEQGILLDTDYLTIAWSPDSSQFAAGAYNFSPEKMATVWIIDPMTGQIIQEYVPHRQTVERMVWNSDGSRLLSVGAANDVAIYDVQRNEVISRLNAYTTINGIAAWNDDNTLLAAADTLENVHVWDTVTGQQVAEYSGHRQMVTEIDWQPHGLLLATRGGDNHNSVNADIHIWDVAHPAQDAPAYLFTHDVTGISAMDWNPNGQILTSVELSGQIHFWDINDPQESYKRLVYQYSALHDVDWNPTGDRIAVLIMSTTSSIMVYDVAQDNFTSIEISSGQTDFTWTPDNDLRLLENWPGFVVTWPIIREFSQPETRTYLKGMVNPINKSYVNTNLRLSPSGRMAAAFDEQQNGLVWDVESGQAIFMLSSIEDIFWSSDETMLAVERGDQSIWVMNASGRILQQLPNKSIRARYYHTFPTILWSPDSQRFAHIADGVITVWALVA